MAKRNFAEDMEDEMSRFRMMGMAMSLVMADDVEEDYLIFYFFQFHLPPATDDQGS